MVWEGPTFLPNQGLIGFKSDTDGWNVWGMTIEHGKTKNEPAGNYSTDRRMEELMTEESKRGGAEQAGLARKQITIIQMAHYTTNSSFLAL